MNDVVKVLDSTLNCVNDMHSDHNNNLLKTEQEIIKHIDDNTPPVLNIVKADNGNWSVIVTRTMYITEPISESDSGIAKTVFDCLVNKKIVDGLIGMTNSLASMKRQQLMLATAAKT